MSKSIILTDREARCPDLRYLIRPVKPNLPYGLLEKFPFPRMIGGNLYFQKSEHEQFPCWEFHYEAPWQPGDKLAVRESWRVVDKDYEDVSGPLPSNECLSDGLSVIYKSDKISYGIKWRSPSTMPRWAARRWLLVEAVACKRVEDVTEEEEKGYGSHSRTYRDGRGYEPATIGFLKLWRKRYSAQWAWVAKVREVRE